MSHAGGENEERITPAAVVEGMLSRGLRRETLIRGSTVIGDFLGPGYSRLVELAGARELIPTAGAKEASWGIREGVEVTILRLPFGAPAAVMVMETYAALGAQRFLVLGAAGSLQPRAPIGSLVVPTEAVVSEGTSRHYGVHESAVPCPSPDLVGRLVAACRRRGVEPHTGCLWTTDAPYRELTGDIRRHSEAGVLAVDMEVSALFSAARFRGLETAVVLAISDEVFGPWNQGFDREQYRKALATAAEAALEVATS